MRRFITAVLNFLLGRHANWSFNTFDGRMWRYVDGQWESRDATAQEEDDFMSGDAW